MGRLYDRRAWHALRRLHLQTEPLCRICAKSERVEPATVVDHIVPHCGDESLFFDRGNLQSLCKACHDSKTYDETLGAGARFPVRVDDGHAGAKYLLCGPPGCGSHAVGYIENICKLTVVDELSLSDMRYNRPGGSVRASSLEQGRRQRDEDIQRLSAYGAAYAVMCYEPRAADRQRWRDLLNAERVFVLELSADRVEERYRVKAERWWKRYTAGRDEDVIFRGS